MNRYDVSTLGTRIMWCKVIQYTTGLCGFVLFLYGILTLPQPVTTFTTTQANPDEVSNAYTSLVVHSQQFKIAMGGVGSFVACILCISFCRGEPVLPVPPRLEPPTEIILA